MTFAAEADGSAAADLGASLEGATAEADDDVGAAGGTAGGGGEGDAASEEAAEAPWQEGEAWVETCDPTSLDDLAFLCLGALWTNLRWWEGVRGGRRD